APSTVGPAPPACYEWRASFSPAPRGRREGAACCPAAAADPRGGTGGAEDRCQRTSEHMNIHEFQAKELLRRHGVAVPRGRVATTAEDAAAAARALGGSLWVVKAQIHAGGRGKGGGVRRAGSVEEVAEIARRMLGMRLVTHQTGPAGRVVRK